MRTTEIVRNPVIASICGHLEGTEGERFFVLLSVGSGVQISSGMPENSLQAFVFKGLQLFFCCFAAFRTIFRRAGMRDLCL